MEKKQMYAEMQKTNHN